MTSMNEVSDLAVGEPVSGSLVPVREPAEIEIAQQLVEQARGQGVKLVGPDGLLTKLTRQVLQAALETEMAEHLGYDKGDPAGRGVPNSQQPTYSSPPTTTEPHDHNKPRTVTGNGSLAPSLCVSARSDRLRVRPGCRAASILTTGHSSLPARHDLDTFVRSIWD